MKMYFEDFNVGNKFVSMPREVTEKDITDFAKLTGDFNRLHVQPEFGRELGYGGIIAHGLLTLSIALGLWYSLDLTNETTVAFLGINGVSFKAPVRPSEHVTLEAEVVSLRESRSRPEVGLATIRMSVKREEGSLIVLEAEPVLMLQRRKK